MKLFFISLGCPLVIIFCLVSVSFAKSVLICPLQEADASVKPRKTVQMKGFCVNVEVFNIGADADCEKIPHPSRPNGDRRAVIHPPAPHHTEIFLPSIGCEALHGDIRGDHLVQRGGKGAELLAIMSGAVGHVVFLGGAAGRRWLKDSSIR